MNDISKFRGFSGEVLTNFLRPGIFLTAIPIFLYWAFILLIFLVLGKIIHPAIGVLILLIASAYLLGRFALPAARGEFEEGFFTQHLASSEARDFMLRYCVLTLLWLIPCILIAMGLFKNMAFMFSMRSGISGAAAGFTGILGLCLYLIMLLAPLFTALVATYTDSIGELFQGDTYSWLFSERRRDLITFLALVMGGIFIFFIVYLIPMALISLIAIKISDQLGFAVMSFMYSTPLMLAPVLVGRTCGAFICGGDSIFAETDENHTAMQNPSTIAAVTQAVSQKTAPSPETTKPARANISTLLKSLEALSSAEIDSLYETLQQQDENAQDLETLFKRSYTAAKKGDAELAFTLGSQVIEQSLNQAAYLDAAEIFLFFRKYKAKLNISTPHYKTLSTAVANRNEFTEATWLLYQHIVKTNAFEDVALQKQILKFADDAYKAQLFAHSFAVYNFFVSNFGSSSFCQFAQERASEVKAKMSE